MKKLIASFLGVQSPFAFLMTLWCRGTFVGRDQFGNKYYTGKARKGYTTDRRFVVYQSGHVEASEVPAEFHGWLHHQTDIFPAVEGKSARRPWQKEHTPNLTGTTLAYRPDGHMMKGGQRAKATGDYEAWMPE